MVIVIIFKFRIRVNIVGRMVDFIVDVLIVFVVILVFFVVIFDGVSYV